MNYLNSQIPYYTIEIIMALSQSECERISNLFETDYNKGFADLIELITLFTKTYGGITCVDSSSQNEFLDDTKLLILLIHKMFVVDEMIEEAQKELCNTSDPIATKECNDYLEFVKNLTALKILFEDPAFSLQMLEDHEPLMKEILFYLEDRNRSMQELTNTMKSLNNSLKTLANALGTIVESS